MELAEEKFEAENPLARWSAHSVLLAVSGGADSTALVRLFHHFRTAFGLKIYVAHANHQLRGAESDGDAAFVSSLCQKLAIPLRAERLQIVRTPDGLEADARRARYAFLEETAEAFGCRYLALAHHRNDQAETILHRILRGTGVAGLAGMARMRPLNGAVTLIRPLLGFSREEILRYLQAIGQEWRTDSSNFSTELTRNRIRQVLLPQLQETFNPQIDEALVRLGALADSMQSFVDSQVEKLAKISLRPAPDGLRVVPVPNVETFLWSELFRRIWRVARLPQQEMGREEWELLVRMLLKEPNAPETHDFPGRVSVIREEEALLLRGNFKEMAFQVP